MPLRSSSAHWHAGRQPHVSVCLSVHGGLCSIWVKVELGAGVQPDTKCCLCKSANREGCHTKL